MEIPTKPFQSTAKTSFQAVGKGELVIDIPNGVKASQVRLTEVLYAPKVGYTLVSVGCLDELGFLTTFVNGVCTICTPSGRKIGEVPHSQHGIYAVMQGSAYEEANTAVEKLTIDQLHARLGHISPNIARRMVECGFVTGVWLDTPDTTPSFYEACMYAKATCKPVPK